MSWVISNPISAAKSDTPHDRRLWLPTRNPRVDGHAAKPDSDDPMTTVQADG